MSQQLSVFVGVELYFNNCVMLFIVLRLYRHFYVLVFDVLQSHPCVSVLSLARHTACLHSLVSSRHRANVVHSNGAETSSSAAEDLGEDLSTKQYALGSA